MNKSQENIFYLSFSIIFLGNILGHVLAIPLLESIFKPMIMTSLLAYFYLKTSSSSSVKPRKLLILSIIFSWFGDMALLLESPEKPYFFMLGLGSFLIAHILYIISFHKMTQNKKGFVQQNLFWAIPFLFFGITIYTFLLPQLKELAIPVLIYMLSIVGMSLFALNIKGIVKSSIFKMLFIGSLLFIFSDTSIAINKFSIPFSSARIVIMSSYILAQFLLIRACVIYISEFK